MIHWTVKLALNRNCQLCWKQLDCFWHQNRMLELVLKVQMIHMCSRIHWIEKQVLNMNCRHH
jgi:hypothetical protein